MKIQVGERERERSGCFWVSYIRKSKELFLEKRKGDYEMIYIKAKGMGIGGRCWVMNGTTKCVNGDDSRWLYGEPADGRKETPRDNYVLQLQPFNLYPFSHNTYQTVSL